MNRALALTAGAFGVYSAAKSAWYLNAQKGCAKCDTTQLLLGAALAVFSGYMLMGGEQWR